MPPHDASAGGRRSADPSPHEQDRPFSPICALISGGSGRVANGTHPEALDLLLLARVYGFASPVFADASDPRPSYFRVEARGLENVPRQQPVIVVWNHSGGSTALDAWGLFALWYRSFGFERPLRAMMHEAAFMAPYIGSWFTRLGMLRADPSNARFCLERLGHSLLVAPGGDYEVFRPARDAHRLCFHNRVGYARMALKSRVPVVPVAHSGAHDTLHVVSRGLRAASLLRIPQLARFCVFPFFLGLPFLLAVGPWVHLPTPAVLRYRFGAPVPLPDVEGEPTEEQVRGYAALVEAEMRRLLAELGEEEARRPLLARNKTRFWIAWTAWACICAGASAAWLRARWRAA